jgi:ribosomal protein S8
MMTDPIGDLLTRIRNAQSRGLSKITSPASKLRATVLDVLVAEGYLRGYLEMEKGGHKELEIERHRGARQECRWRSVGARILGSSTSCPASARSRSRCPRE